MGATVLVTDYAWPSLDIERSILGEVGADLVVACTGAEAELVELAANVDAILTCWGTVTGAVLRAARNCVAVARYGVGLDNIDVSSATELGIVVSNVPDFCTEEVADHAMALLLGHMRRIVAYDRQIRAGGWDPQAVGAMHRLRGLVLGLIGFGRIAQALAQRAQAFGMTVMAFTPSRIGSPARDGVVFTRTLRELLKLSDVVSLHLPATAETHHILDAESLAACKPGALLINTSRGALLDEEALVHSLRHGQLSGAALDVLTAEPPPSEHVLRQEPTVTLTPHAAFVSVEALAELQTKAARNVAAALQGCVPDAIVNSEVLESPALRMAVQRGD